MGQAAGAICVSHLCADVQQEDCPPISPHYLDYQKLEGRHYLSLSVASRDNCNNADLREHPDLREQPLRYNAEMQIVEANSAEQNEVEVAKLIFASARGNLEQVQRLLEGGVSANAVDYDRRSALHIAAAEARIDVVRFLIQAKADCTLKDRWDSTPLDGAHCSETRAVLLAAAGASLADCSTSGTTEEFHKRATPFSTSESSVSAMHSSDDSLPGAPCLPTQNRPLLKDAKGSAQPQTIDEGLLKDASEKEQWAIPASEVTLEKVLSKTNKSVVHLASWRGTAVVAKKIKDVGELQDAADSPHLVRELLHEINVLSKCRHPDLVLFLGACFDSSPCFFISEYMEGGDLDTLYENETRRLGRRYKASWPCVLRWANAVARALCFLHNCRHPIIHRDLKPLNLFLTANRDMKVADFGISKIVDQKDMQEATAPVMSGGVGTWRYMAPEVVRHEQYTDRVDIYSFGLILFFMATGCPPFMEEFGSDAEVILKEYIKGNDPRPKLSSSIGTGDFRKIMTDSWKPVAIERPSAKECAERLAALTQSTQSGGLLSSTIEKISRRMPTKESVG